MKKLFLLSIICFFSFLTNLQAQKLVYAGGRTANNISIIDIDTNVVISTIAGITSPRGMAFTPDGNYLYVTNDTSAANNLYIIDVATSTLVNTLSVGTNPYGIVITPDGTKAYVSNNGSNNVSVIDIATNTVSSTIPVGGTPHPIEITPDQTKVYVGNANDGTVSIIDIATDLVTNTVSVGGSNNNPTSIAFTSTRAYLTRTNQNAIAIIDLATEILLPQVPTLLTLPYGIAITPDQTTAYITNASGVNDVSLFDIATNAFLATTIPVGSNPFYIEITPDGTAAYVANFSSNNVSVIDIATNTTSTTVAVGAGPLGLAILYEFHLLSAESKNNSFFFLQRDLTNSLTWTNPGNTLVIEYLIYRDNELIGTVSGQTLEFIDHSRKAGTTSNYSVVSNTISGLINIGDVSLTASG